MQQSREYLDQADFLFSNVLRPLNWIGYLVLISETGQRFDNAYWKTPLWRACFNLGMAGIMKCHHVHDCGQACGLLRIARKPKGRRSRTGGS